MQIFYKVLLYIFQYVKLTMDFLRGHQLCQALILRVLIF